MASCRQSIPQFQRMALSDPDVREDRRQVLIASIRLALLQDLVASLFCMFCASAAGHMYVI